MEPNTINWDKQPLGKKTDKAIADKLGCSIQAVCKARNDRAIPSFREQGGTRDQGIPWGKLPLGEVPNWLIARWVGVSRQTVYGAIRLRGLKPYSGGADLNPKRLAQTYKLANLIRWEVQDWSVSNESLAAFLHVPRPLVARKRPFAEAA